MICLKGKIPIKKMQAYLIQRIQRHILSAPVITGTCPYTQQERIRCSAILAIRSSLSKSSKQMTAMMKNAAPLVCKKTEQKTPNIFIIFSNRLI